MRPRTIVAAVSAAASLLVVGAIAVAQEHPGMPPGHMQQMQEHHARMLGDLHAILQIRPDQEAAFKALQDSIKPPPAPAEARAMPAGDITTPQMFAMIDQHEAAMKAHLDSHKAAILALYGVLSPDQKKAFDAVMRQHIHGMMGGMHGMGMGHMGMMGHMGQMGGMGGPGGPMGGPPPN